MSWGSGPGDLVASLGLESWQCADSMQELECRLTCHGQGRGICSELSIPASQVRTLKSSVGIRSLKVVSASAREATEMDWKPLGGQGSGGMVARQSLYEAGDNSRIHNLALERWVP